MTTTLPPLVTSPYRHIRSRGNTWTARRGTLNVLTVKDDGVVIGTRRQINFTGAGVTVTDDPANDQVNVAVSGGGGGSALTVKEEDGSPSDTAVTEIQVPNGTLTVDSAGVVSLDYEKSGLAILKSLLTTLGDVIFRDGSSAARLAGNTTTKRKFLRQMGTGAISAAPAWDVLYRQIAIRLETTDVHATDIVGYMPWMVTEAATFRAIAHAQVAPANTQTFQVLKNGTLIDTITITGGSQTGTLGSVDITVTAAGDYFEVRHTAGTAPGGGVRYTVTLVEQA